MENISKKRKKTCLSKMSFKEKNRESDLISVLRVIGYEKVHNRNPSSRMFTYFAPIVSKETAVGKMNDSKVEICGIPAISARKLNKCFGFRGNDISTVVRAVDEMRRMFKMTQSSIFDVEFMERKRGDRRKLLDLDSAVKIISYVYSNRLEQGE